MIKFALGGLAAAGVAAFAIPAIAQAPAPAPHGAAGHHRMHGAMGDKSYTRAEVSARVAEHFAKLDVNRDGFVTRAEADAARETVHKQMGERRAERRDNRFERIDTNNDGTISRGEWDQAGANRTAIGMGEAGRTGQVVRRMMVHRLGALGGRMFEQADGNRDGRVSLAEAQGAALQHFDRMDANRDGQLTPDERRVIRREIVSERRPG
jgi:hypothetical protein